MQQLRGELVGERLTTSRSAPGSSPPAPLAAMTFDRPYADRRDTAAALDELDRTAGTHFDPLVVAALRQPIRQPANA